MDDPVSSPFLLGVNYWPRQAAMYWWSRFDQDTVRRDFEQLRALGYIA